VRAARSARDVVKPGDIVRVKVLEVDKPRKRISLTLRLDDEAGAQPARSAGAERGASKRDFAKAQTSKANSSGGALADALRRAELGGRNGANRTLSAADSTVQRGSNENTNGFLRQYFPKGTDLSRFSQAHLNRIALRLNQRPRKTLGFETPADRLRAVLH
jgi:S1 RNA binding domain